MLVTTYQSTRCHNKESHNIYLCSWKRLYLLLHPLFSSPFLSFTRAVYCIPLWKDSKQSVLTCFLRPPPHGLNPIAAVWTQFVPSAVHLVPVSESFYTFCISCYWWCSECLNISICCPQLCWFTNHILKFQHFFFPKPIFNIITYWIFLCYPENAKYYGIHCIIFPQNFHHSSLRAVHVTAGRVVLVAIPDLLQVWVHAL